MAGLDTGAGLGAVAGLGTGAGLGTVAGLSTGAGFDTVAGLGTLTLLTVIVFSIAAGMSLDALSFTDSF